MKGGRDYISQIPVMEKRKERNQIIYLVKGMGIVLMVVRHAEAPYSDFVLLFHMAIFFIASGYLYNDKHAESIQSVVKFTLRKLRSLYLPFFLYSVSAPSKGAVFSWWKSGPIRC